MQHSWKDVHVLGVGDPPEFLETKLAQQIFLLI